MSDPQTTDPTLWGDLWREIKGARDDAEASVEQATASAAALNDLLDRMKVAGMADHLPTMDDAQKAFQNE